MSALRQGGIEASEEMLTECANIISDAMVMGERSGLSTAIKEYKEQGMTEDKAVLQACLDSIGQVVVAGWSGFLSGIGMAGGKLAINQAGSAIYNRLTQNQQTMIPTIQGATEAQKTATDGVAGLPKMTMADFTDVDSPVWRNVDYVDTETKRQITRDTHQQMVSEGRVVQIPESTIQQVGQSFPDLRTQKKKIRNATLKHLFDGLKMALREFLGGMKETSFDFEVNGNILEATLYGTGIREVMEKVTQDKASMLYHSAEIFDGAQYLYSTPDYNGDPNIYRWNYFYTPVQIGEKIVGVRIAVRDMARGQNMNPESQIYNWGIKKDTSLDGGGRGPKVASPRVSSDVPSMGSIPQTAQDVNIETGKDMAAPASQPVDPLIADIHSRGAGQTVTQPIDPLIADIRSRGAGQTDAGTEYQIKTLPDGKKYVQADRQVIFGNDPESWSRQLEDYINGKIRRGEDVQLVAADGDVLTLTADTAGKVSSQFRGDGTKLSTAEFERKVAAGAHIDELVEVSRSQGKVRADEEARHGGFASQGWDYRDAYFQDFDGKYYKVMISTALNEDGKVVYNIGKMRKRDFLNRMGSSAKSGAQGVEKVSIEGLPTVDGSSAKGGAQNGEKTSLGDSVSQSGGEVKSKAGISQTAVQGQTASQPVDPLIADIRSRGAGQTDTDATANFAKVAGAEKGLVYDDYVKNELAKETADRINALAKRLNLRVRFVDSIANGVADGQIMDADIQIAKDAQNPAMVVLGHEVGHWLEKTAPKEYQTIQQFVSQRQQAEIDYRIAEYAAVGKELDYDAAQREFVNDYIGEMIANPETLDRFINENRENRSLLQKVADALRALWQKLTGRERQQVKTAEDALLAALRASEKQTTALEKAGQTINFSTEMAEAGAEYSIRFDEKGAIAVLEGKFDSDRKAVYSYLQGLVSKDAFAMVLADAQEVYIGKDLPGEYTQSESTKALFERIRKDKFRASHILTICCLLEKMCGGRKIREESMERPQKMDGITIPPALLRQYSIKMDLFGTTIAIRLNLL